jgi:hypothetical protein
MSKLVDRTGQRIGILTVKEKAKSRNGDTYWLCVCDCGNEVEVRADHLGAKKIRSCGCNKGNLIAQKKTKHGMTKSRLFRIWNCMIQRCENEKNSASSWYHDRGIAVCEEWHSFENFRIWAFTNGYTEDLTIDRKNNDGGYSPDNCQWVDRIIQANNKRNNRRIEYNGKTKTLAQWAREYGIDYRKLWARLKRGWEFETALMGESAA